MAGWRRRAGSEVKDPIEGPKDRCCPAQASAEGTQPGDRNLRSSILKPGKQRSFPYITTLTPLLHEAKQVIQKFLPLGVCIELVQLGKD